MRTGSNSTTERRDSRKHFVTSRCRAPSPRRADPNPGRSACCSAPPLRRPRDHLPGRSDSRRASPAQPLALSPPEPTEAHPGSRSSPPSPKLSGLHLEALDRVGAIPISRASAPNGKRTLQVLPIVPVPLLTCWSQQGCARHGRMLRPHLISIGRASNAARQRDLHEESELHQSVSVAQITVISALRRSRTTMVWSHATSQNQPVQGD